MSPKNKNIQLLFFLLTFFVLLNDNIVLLVEMRPLSCAADKFADGCSVPTMFPAPFKEEFTRACNRHDICYGCGHHYNWSRLSCDNSFYNDMKSTCAHLRNRRSVFESVLDIWNTLGAMGSKRSHCESAAKLYYEGVHLFAASHFDVIDHDYCISRCAYRHGNPKFNITF